MGGIGYVSVFILTALFVFGCLGAPQTPPAGDDTTVPPSGDGDTAPGDTPEAPTQPDEPALPDTDNLEGLGYEALLALGQSLECDVTIPYGTMTSSAKLYIKSGSEDMRMEVTGQNPECPTTISIMKDGDMYMACATGPLFEGMDCDWLLLTAEPDPTEPSTGFEAPDFADVSPANIQCKLWVYDATKFDTPGTVCSLEDIFQGYLPGDYPQ
jgi:hypothetical protein